MSRASLGLDDRLQSYLLTTSLRESPVLKALREETARLPEAEMQIAPEQGQFMALLIKLIGARQVLEIGVFTGYSTLAVALALPKDGRIVACDISEQWTQMARRYWEKAEVVEKIDLRIAPALTTLANLRAQGQEACFDFAFIDADKENYSHYYEHALALLRPGGLIAVDNTLWGGRVADLSYQDTDTVAIRKFNDALLIDKRIDLSLLPLADGLTLVRKLG